MELTEFPNSDFQIIQVRGSSFEPLFSLSLLPNLINIIGSYIGHYN